MSTCRFFILCIFLLTQVSFANGGEGAGKWNPSLCDRISKLFGESIDPAERARLRTEINFTKDHKWSFENLIDVVDMSSDPKRSRELDTYMLRMVEQNSTDIRGFVENINNIAFSTSARLWQNDYALHDLLKSLVKKYGVPKTLERRKFLELYEGYSGKFGAAFLVHNGMRDFLQFIKEKGSTEDVKLAKFLYRISMESDFRKRFIDQFIEALNKKSIPDTISFDYRPADGQHKIPHLSHAEILRQNLVETLSYREAVNYYADILVKASISNNPSQGVWSRYDHTTVEHSYDLRFHRYYHDFWIDDLGWPNAHAFSKEEFHSKWNSYCEEYSIKKFSSTTLDLLHQLHTQAVKKRPSPGRIPTRRRQSREPFVPW